MEIQCPECQTRFRVNPGRLRPTGTPVRCSVCGHRFYAYPPANEDEGAEGLDDEPEGPEGPPAAASPEEDGWDQGETGTGELFSGSGAAEWEPTVAEVEPAAAEQPGRPGRALFMGLVVVLSLALVAELAYAFRAPLLATGWVRGGVSIVLEGMGMDRQLPVAVRHYRVKSVSVRDLRLQSGRTVTVIRGTLTNGAGFDQLAPRAEVRGLDGEQRLRFRKVKELGRRMDLEDGAPAPALADSWQRARTAFPERFRAGQSVDFALLLEQVPAGVSRFRLELIGRGSGGR